MSDERMIRIDNLRLLLKQRGWTKADLAREIKKSDTYVSRLLNGKASFGEKAARYIEDKTRSGRGWLDVVHLEGEYSEAPLTTAPDPAAGAYALPAVSPTIASDSDGDTLIPVITWEKLDMLYLENTRPEFKDAQKAPSEGRVTASTKWLVMNDDSMASRFPQGSKLKVVPVRPSDAPPSAGKFVVVRDKNKVFAVRRYKVVSGKHFQAEPLNTGYAALDSERDGLTVVGLVIQALIDC